MIQNKYVIGLVGGIGSGKSTAAAYISAFYDVDVIMADDVGRELMLPGRPLFAALTEAYGTEILDEEGRIDKKVLSAIAFKDEESQKKINEIEHPVIKEKIIQMIRGSRYEVIFLEAALLIEGGLKELCDEIWLVSAKEDVRIERLMKNRGYTEEKCRQLIALQMSDQEFKKHCSLVIHNNRDRNELREETDYYMVSLENDLMLSLRKT
ncbi:MAG: dephospho-CoA kinase [Lachnospiraceae bacterium]|nr:dephospho-CoA kinase [Lachnospiraceae bacterium]